MSVVFLFICLLSLFFLYQGTGRNKRLLKYFVLWQCIVGILAYLEVFLENPILFPLVILLTIVLIAFALRKITITHIHTNFLLANHILRIPVELILYQLFLKGEIPRIMTYHGYNFDIVMGVSAVFIIVFKLLTERHLNLKFIWFWNILGILFLTIIVSLAILSSPLPIQQFAFDQPNIAVLMFPYCFLPTCVVPIVLLSHIYWLKINALTYNIH